MTTAKRLAETPSVLPNSYLSSLVNESSPILSFVNSTDVVLRNRTQVEQQYALQL